MSQLHSQPIKTFSIGFKEEAYNETSHARLIAKRFNTEHYELTVGPAIQDLLPKLVRHFDEPFGGPSAVPTYLVSELARRHVTVALSGDGGDEAFLGYNSYSAARSRSYRKWLPQSMCTLFGGIGDRMPEQAIAKRFLQSFAVDDPRYFCTGLTELWKRRLFSQDFLKAIPGANTMSVDLRTAFAKSPDGTDDNLWVPRYEGLPAGECPRKG
jgi:asparagine synthase (glutamine-hydrolysing)